MFLENYLNSEWTECSFEDTIPFIIASKKWDYALFTEHADTPWFGVGEKVDGVLKGTNSTPLGAWSAVHTLNADGKIVGHMCSS